MAPCAKRSMHRKRLGQLLEIHCKSCGERHDDRVDKAVSKRSVSLNLLSLFTRHARSTLAQALGASATSHHARHVHNLVHSAGGQSERSSGCDMGVADVARQKRRGRSSPVGRIDRNDPFCRALKGMDDLLKRADRTIEDSRRIRSKTKEHLARGRLTSARVKGTLQWVRAECARSRRLGLEAADRCSSSKFPPPERCTIARLKAPRIEHVRQQSGQLI
jgi:hypothetical protein